VFLVDMTNARQDNNMEWFSFALLCALFVSQNTPISFSAGVYGMHASISLSLYRFSSLISFPYASLAPQCEVLQKLL
jgi:hypothetical protein